MRTMSISFFEGGGSGRTSLQLLPRLELDAGSGCGFTVGRGVYPEGERRDLNEANAHLTLRITTVNRRERQERRSRNGL